MDNTARFRIALIIGFFFVGFMLYMEARKQRMARIMATMYEGHEQQKIRAATAGGVSRNRGNAQAITTKNDNQNDAIIYVVFPYDIPDIGGDKVEIS